MSPTRRTTKYLFWGIAVATLVMAAGCGNSSGVTSTNCTDYGGGCSDPSTASTSEQSSPDGGKPTPQPVPNFTLHKYTFTFLGSNGEQIAGFMAFAPVLRADDPKLAATWQGFDTRAPATAQCATGGARDGVVVGEVSFTNPNPDFPPDGFNVIVSSKGMLNEVNFEWYPADGGGCDHPSTGGVANLNPNITGARWGPVPVAFTIHNLYGPGGVDSEVAHDAASLVLSVSSRSSPGGKVRAGEHMHDTNGGLPNLFFTLPVPSS